jgi:hypothetical protein
MVRILINRILHIIKRAAARAAIGTVRAACPDAKGLLARAYLKEARRRAPPDREQRLPIGLSER